MSESPSTTGHHGLLQAVVGRAKTTWDIIWAAGNQVASGGTDRAAGLAYYAIQAVFPGLFVVVFLSLLLSTQDSINQAIDWAVRKGLDPGLAKAIQTSVSAAAERAGGGGAVTVAAAIAALAAISSASGWFGAAGRAIEPDPERRRSRNIITGRLRSAFWTVVMVGLLVGALAMLATGGTWADQLFKWLGIDGSARAYWNLLRPPLVIFGIVTAVLLIYRVAPDRRHPVRFRHLLPGALVGGFGWMVASLGFFFYIGNLATIGATYGAFATPIVLLLWLWLSGVVVLFGAEINAELARRRGEFPHPICLPGADDPDIAGHPAGRLPDADDDEWR